jgi:hypothetical protein
MHQAASDAVAHSHAALSTTIATLSNNLVGGLRTTYNGKVIRINNVGNAIVGGHDDFLVIGRHDRSFQSATTRITFVKSRAIDAGNAK